MGKIFLGAFCLIFGIAAFAGMYWIPHPVLVIFGLVGIIAGAFELADGIRGKWTYFSITERRFK